MSRMALPKHFLPVKGTASGRALWLAESSKGGTLVRVALTHPPAA